MLHIIDVGPLILVFTMPIDDWHTRTIQQGPTPISSLRITVLAVQQQASIPTPTLVLALSATGITFRILLCSSASSYKYCAHHIAPSPFSIFSTTCSAAYIQFNPIPSSTTPHHPISTIPWSIYTTLRPPILFVRLRYLLRSIVQRSSQRYLATQ